MKKILIANAFALSMLDREAQNGTPNGYVAVCGESIATCRVPRPCDDPGQFLADADRWDVPVRSVVGHADTAAVFSSVLGRVVAHNRETVKLAPDDILLVGQYIGPRLPEGATALPEGATIEWWIV
jgi:hypothetical protein